MALQKAWVAQTTLSFLWDCFHQFQAISWFLLPSVALVGIWQAHLTATKHNTASSSRLLCTTMWNCSLSFQFSSFQSLSHAWLFVTPWTAVGQASLSITSFPDLTQTHGHQVSDAIQPSHPLSSPSPPAFNLSQHQGLFQWISSLNQVAKVLEFQLQHQSFQWIFRTDFL